MNKPTIEQIEHRAIEILSSLDDKESDCDYCRVGGEDCCHQNCARELMLSALEQAEKELTKTKLSEINRYELAVILKDLKKATGHEYTHIEKITKPIRHTRFYLKERLGVKNVFDTVSGTYLCLLSLELNKKYSIEDLLNE